MTHDILAFDHLRQLDKLKTIVGGLDECVRLGFLLYVVAGDIKSLAEAFAAGWQAASDFNR